MRRVKYNKYKNTKVVNEYGKFDSEKEWLRYRFLLAKVESGEITELQRQVPYELIPKLYDTYTEVTKRGKERIICKPLQQPCIYKADYVYNRNGEQVVEDVKGSLKMLTPEFRLKMKILRWKHDITIKIVTKVDEW